MSIVGLRDEIARPGGSITSSACHRREAPCPGVGNGFALRHGPGIGAEIMGAGKFGPPGWQDDSQWRGWWRENPPFHTPTYVLTHRPRSPLEMEGGTTFYCITHLTFTR